MSRLVLRGEPAASEHLHLWACAVCGAEPPVEHGKTSLDRLIVDMRAVELGAPHLLEASRIMQEARMLISSPDTDLKDAVDVLWIGEQHIRYLLNLTDTLDTEEAADGD